MTLREQYDALAAESDDAYAVAGDALRLRNYQAYKLHVDKAWELAERATIIRKQLPEAEQCEIRAQALADVATGFVRGLGRRT